MPDQSNGASTLHALLIAADCYLPGHLPDGSYYPSLAGCVRDVSHVEGFLRGTLKVGDDRIIKLTSTNMGASRPPEPPEALPTYENMVNAFRTLTKHARSGDQVYVHYSGHGGRTPTIYLDRKGPDALDESLVPIDIHHPNARYLRDLELAALLKEMTDKGLAVTIVLDCCHSGGATRGLNEVAERGVEFIDRTPRPTESLVSLPADLKTRNVNLGTGWLLEPQGYTLMAACRPSESAYEFAFDGKERNGALTYWLLDSLQQLGPGLTYKMVHERILARVHSQFERQTPMLQGEADRVFFGVGRVPPQFATIVMQVDTTRQRVLLQSGQAVGVRKGAQFAIYPQGAVDLNSAAGRKAVVQVATLGATESWATLVSPAEGLSIEPGDQAVLLGAGSAKLVRGVRLMRHDGQPASAEDVAFEAVAQALPAAASGWIELAAPETPAEFGVTITEKGDAYEICDRAGMPITNLRPALKIDDPQAPAAVVRRLVHLAKYRAVQDLDNFDANSPLKGKLKVELAGVQEDYDPADRPEPKPFADPAGVPTLKADPWTQLFSDVSCIALWINSEYFLTRLYSVLHWFHKRLEVNVKNPWENRCFQTIIVFSFGSVDN